MGTFIFCTMFMLQTNKKTRFSKDKVLNSLIISAAYIAARLMCGG